MITETGIEADEDPESLRLVHEAQQMLKDWQPTEWPPSSTVRIEIEHEVAERLGPPPEVELSTWGEIESFLARKRAQAEEDADPRPAPTGAHAVPVPTTSAPAEVVLPVELTEKTPLAIEAPKAPAKARRRTATKKA